MRTRRIIQLFMASLAVAGCAGPGLAPSEARLHATVRASDQTEAEVARLRARLERMPTDLKSQCLLAAALMQKGRETGDIGAYQEARRATEAALKSAPDSLDAQVTAAWSATVFHDFDTAVRLAERALESDPGAASAYGIVCDSRLELGDYDAAADAAQAMMDRKPNLASYSRAAHVRWFFGDVKGAILLMKKAAEAGGGREAVAWCRVQLADMMAKSGAYPAAEAEYERALAGLPGYRHALAGLARARFASGHAEEAVRLMRKATEVGPTVSNLDDLGDMLAAAGRKDEAEEAHRRAAGLMGSHLAAGIGGDEPAVARLWLSRGEREQEALRLMEAEVEHHKSVAVYATLAWAQAVAGQKDQARASVVQALRTGVREPWVLRRCGEVLEACGDPEGGGRLLAEARAVCPSEQAWRLL